MNVRLAGSLLGLALASSVGCAHTPEAAPVESPAPAPVASTPAATPAPETASSPAAGTQPVTEAPGDAPRRVGGPGAACGGIAGLGCAEGLFCSFPLEAHCGAADQTGTCQPKPGACRKVDEPVCGCDDRTYPTECLANASGISVARSGDCAKK